MNLDITIADWPTQQAAAQTIRLAVFVTEQHVPLELEWDVWDAQSWHAVARVDGQIVGTGRLLPDGHIGRMAVLPAWRGKKIGTTLLQALLEKARQQNCTHVQLHAQVHALAFYIKAGFVAEGETFMEAGIPHYRMTRLLVSS